MPYCHSMKCIHLHAYAHTYFCNTSNTEIDTIRKLLIQIMQKMQSVLLHLILYTSNHCHNYSDVFVCRDDSKCRQSTRVGTRQLSTSEVQLPSAHLCGLPTLWVVVTNEDVAVISTVIASAHRLFLSAQNTYTATLAHLQPITKVTQRCRLSTAVPPSSN